MNTNGIDMGKPGRVRNRLLNCRTRRGPLVRNQSSRDQGRTWSRPTRIVNLEETTDGGYPSTVQLADGTLLTAYYSNRVPQHQRYHMGAVRWILEKE